MNDVHRVAEGDTLPALPLRVLRDGHWQDVESDQLFSGRRVIVFGLPGAFTPTCSSQHLPRYEELARVFLARGIDEVICASVNDSYVMEAWAKEEGAQYVTMLADGNGEFSAALGLLVDRSDAGFGRRSQRYSMLVNDGRIERCFVEPEEDGDPYTVSDADTMLRAIDPEAQPPDQVVMFSREGCEHCARARALLEQAGFNYVEIPLDPDVRGRVVGALSRRTSVPLVFLNGQIVGGADELEALVCGPTASRPN